MIGAGPRTSAARPVPGPRVLGVGSSAPLIVRGPAPIIGWAPTTLRQPHDDLSARVLDLYRHLDPPLGDALAAGIEAVDVVENAEGVMGKVQTEGDAGEREVDGGNGDGSGASPGECWRATARILVFQRLGYPRA